MVARGLEHPRLAAGAPGERAVQDVAQLREAEEPLVGPVFSHGRASWPLAAAAGFLLGRGACLYLVPRHPIRLLPVGPLLVGPNVIPRVFATSCVSTLFLAA